MQLHMWNSSEYKLAMYHLAYASIMGCTVYRAYITLNWKSAILTWIPI